MRAGVVLKEWVILWMRRSHAFLPLWRNLQKCTLSHARDEAPLTASQRGPAGGNHITISHDEFCVKQALSVSVTLRRCSGILP